MENPDLQRPLIDDLEERRKPFVDKPFYQRLVPFMVLVAVLLPLSLAYSKAMLDSGSVFVWEDVYAKGAVCLLVLGIAMRCCLNVSPFQIETSQRWRLLVGATALALGYACVGFALQYLPVCAVFTSMALIPVFIASFKFVMTSGKATHLLELTAVFVGDAGVVVLGWGMHGTETTAFVATLAAGFLFTLALRVLRQTRNSWHYIVPCFYFALAVCIFSPIVMHVTLTSQRVLVVYTFHRLFYIVLNGVVWALAVVCIVRSNVEGQVLTMSAMNAGAFVFIALIDLAYFDVVFTVTATVGLALIFAASMALSLMKVTTSE